jgi:hypothetical protein
VTSIDKAALMRIGQSSVPLDSPHVPRPSRYYTIRLQMSEPGHGVVGHWDIWWIPSTGALAAPGDSGWAQWSRISNAANAFLRRQTVDTRPFPAPRLTRVFIGGRPARDPNSYLELFASSWPVSYESASDWQRITIVATAPSPWTNHVSLQYSPSTNVLWRGAERFEVPARIAANIEAARSLDAAASGRSYAWAWAAGAAALLSAVAATVRRRRRRGA